MRTKSISILFVVLVAMVAVGCSTVPSQTGLEPFVVRQPQVQMFDNRPYLVIEFDTNPAQALAEPYPSMIVYIWSPETVPDRFETEKKNLQAQKAGLLKMDKSNSEYKRQVAEYNRDYARYAQSYREWAYTSKPRDVVKSPAGGFYKAVGIDFRGPDGNLVEVVKNNEITIEPKQLSSLTPWYGGRKRAIIYMTKDEFVKGNYRAVTMGSDKSDAKCVYDLEGKGMNGEKWGTRYSSFNPQVHGVKFTDDNPRFYEVIPGSAKDKEIKIWGLEVIKKAAIVTVKEDAAEFLAHPELNDYKGVALDSWEQIWLERRTSRTHAFWQGLSSITANPVVFLSSHAGEIFTGFGIGAFLNVSYSIFGDRQYYFYGSAGSFVKNKDFQVGLLEVKESFGTLKNSQAFNHLVDQYNNLSVAWENETDASRREEINKERTKIKTQMDALK